MEFVLFSTHEVYRTGERCHKLNLGYRFLTQNRISSLRRGYLAPESLSYGHVSDKVDVFSFGVLCLEIVGGRRNIDEKYAPDKMYLSKWVRLRLTLVFILHKFDSSSFNCRLRGLSSVLAKDECYKFLWSVKDVGDITSEHDVMIMTFPEINAWLMFLAGSQAWDLHRHNRLMGLVDPYMSLQDDEKEQVHRLINIALLCIQHEAEPRPSMERVVAMLQGESEAEVVPLKPSNDEQYLERIRLFAMGKGGLGTVKEEGESSFMESRRRSEDMDYSAGGVLQLSEIRVR